MSTEKDIPGPIWEMQVDNWLSHIPDRHRNPQDVDYLVSLSVRALQDKMLTDPIPGLRERTFSDALFLREKALYCCRVRSSLNRAGQPTWTALAMYDACFFAAKSLCYLMGIRDLGINSNFYINLFYVEQLSRKKTRDTHQFIKLKQRMTHEMVWIIFPRIIRTIKGNSQAVTTIRQLRKWDFDDFTRERNSLIYRANTWSRSDNLDQSDLNFDVSYLDNIAYDQSCGEFTAEYYDRYYRFAQIILGVIDCLLAEIGISAPAIQEYLIGRPGRNLIESVQAA